jgi:hypothetical protein
LVVSTSTEKSARHGVGCIRHGHHPLPIWPTTGTVRQPGSAEETFGQVMQHDLRPYRDEIIVSSKAGYYMLAWSIWR